MTTGNDLTNWKEQSAHLWSVIETQSNALKKLDEDFKRRTQGRPYIDNYLDAALFMKNFEAHIELKGIDFKDVKQFLCYVLHPNFDNSNVKYYIPDHKIGLLIIQTGDMAEDIYGYSGNFNDGELITGEWADDRGEPPFTILSRDGKPFPKIEYEDVE